MQALEVGRNTPKVIAAWGAEKVGRLKPNGQLRGYSPLSRLIELEMLQLGIAGKMAMWTVLDSAADPRLAAFDLPALIAAPTRSETWSRSCTWRPAARSSPRKLIRRGLALVQGGRRCHMGAIKSKLARKAAKSTAKHTAHGTASKLRRDPLRSTTLLVVGLAVGVLIGRGVGRDSDRGGGSVDEAESASRAHPWCSSRSASPPAAATATTPRPTRSPPPTRPRPKRRRPTRRTAASGELERSPKVDIVEFTYDPEPVQVETGGKVIWQNQDSAPHTATADDGSFDTGTLEQGKLKSESFKEAGTYTYFCEIHPTMHGTVEVVDKP